MRIATNRATNNFLKRLENNYSQKYDSESKISSFRQFQYASEAPAQAASAMRVRKAIENLNNYQDNLKTAKSIYDTAESAVMAISELIQSTYEKCIEAANGTHTKDQMEILANEIDTFADEMCRLMNLNVADRKIFGGTNNTERAFRIEGPEGGRYVTYNGIPVNQYSDPKLFPYSNSSYTDVGLGMKLNPDYTIDEQSALKITFNGMEVLGCGIAYTTGYVGLGSIEAGKNYEFEIAVGDNKYTIPFEVDASVTTEEEIRDVINQALADAGLVTITTNTTTNTDGSTSVTKTYRGIHVTESGLIINNASSDQISVRSTGKNDFVIANQEAGYSNNVIQNILDAAQCIRGMDGEEIARFADQVYSLQTTVSLALADFGHNSQFIEFNQTRITNNLYSLTERQDDLESTDLAEESSIWKLLDAIYSASLQMTTTAVPQSIFDFIR